MLSRSNFHGYAVLETHPGSWIWPGDEWPEQEWSWCRVGRDCGEGERETEPGEMQPKFSQSSGLWSCSGHKGYWVILNTVRSGSYHLKNRTYITSL